MNLKVAALQLVSTADIDDNLQRCERLLGQAHSAGAEMVALPENALNYGAPLDLVASRQEEIKRNLAEWARHYRLWLVGGSLPWLDTDYASRPSASCFVFNSEGEEVLHYRKIHLFDADVTDATGSYRESDSYSAGSTPGMFDSPWGRFGVGICYDLRFPEYFRVLAQQDVQAILLPSAFTYVTGEAHWEILVRARAIENQVFMLAPNQGGQHSPKRKTWGQSMIVDPWGRILAQTHQGEHLVLADINFDELAGLRQQMPVLQHRKLLE